RELILCLFIKYVSGLFRGLVRVWPIAECESVGGPRRQNVLAGMWFLLRLMVWRCIL
ncbi:hypothetical protein CSUI_007023, partial [Cystoisospora suis]